MSTTADSIHLSFEMFGQLSVMARSHYRPDSPLPYHNYDDHVEKAKGYFSQISTFLYT